MGNICLNWRAGSKILHFLCRLWRTRTCPTNAYPCLSWLDHPFYAVCCRGKMPHNQQQMVLTRKERLPCRWTANKEEHDDSVNKNQYWHGLIKRLNQGQERWRGWKGFIHTHLPLVWTGPKPLMAVYSLKYWGTDRPMKIEKPNMNFTRKLLRLQNWRKLRPPAPAHAHWNFICHLLQLITLSKEFGHPEICKSTNLNIHTHICKEKAI